MLQVLFRPLVPCMNRRCRTTLIMPEAFKVWNFEMWDEIETQDGKQQR